MKSRCYIRLIKKQQFNNISKSPHFFSMDKRKIKPVQAPHCRFPSSLPPIYTYIYTGTRKALVCRLLKKQY